MNLGDNKIESKPTRGNIASNTGISTKDNLTSKGNKILATTNIVVKEENYQKELVNLITKLKTTGIILQANSDMLKLLAKKDNNVAKLLDVFNSSAEERDKSLKNILDRKDLSTEEAASLVSTLEDAVESIENVDTTLDIKLTDILSSYKELIADTRIDQKTKIDLLREVQSYTSSSVSSSDALKELKKINLDTYHLDSSNTPKMVALLTQVQAQTKNEVLHSTLTELNKKFDKSVLTQQELTRVFTSPTKSGKNFKEQFQESPQAFSKGEGNISGGLTSFLMHSIPGGGALEALGVGDWMQEKLAGSKAGQYVSDLKDKAKERALELKDKAKERAIELKDKAKERALELKDKVLGGTKTLGEKAKRVLTPSSVKLPDRTIPLFQQRDAEKKRNAALAGQSGGITDLFGNKGKGGLANKAGGVGKAGLGSRVLGAGRAGLSGLGALSGGGAAVGAATLGAGALAGLGIQQAYTAITTGRSEANDIASSLGLVKSKADLASGKDTRSNLNPLKWAGMGLDKSMEGAAYLSNKLEGTSGGGLNIPKGQEAKFKRIQELQDQGIVGPELNKIIQKEFASSAAVQVPSNISTKGITAVSPSSDKNFDRESWTKGEKALASALKDNTKATGGTTESLNKIADPSWMDRLSGALSKGAAWVKEKVDKGAGWLQEKTKGTAFEGAGAAVSSAMKKGVGAVSAQFETGGRGAGTVSTGKGDAGGASYGTYQFASQGGDSSSAAKFVKSSSHAKEFAGLTPGTPAFNEKWKEVSAKDPNFGSEQESYIGKTHYDPQMKKLKDSGIDLSGKGKAVQEAVWSTSVQHGADSGIIQKALDKKDVSKMSDKDITNAIQDYKASHVEENFKSSSPEVRASVAKRIQREKAVLSGIADETDKKFAGAGGASGGAGASGKELSKTVTPQQASAVQSKTVTPQSAAVLSKSESVKETPTLRMEALPPTEKPVQKQVATTGGPRSAVPSKEPDNSNSGRKLNIDDYGLAFINSAFFR